MGKKGTKRKTKWRALPLGEDAAGSGNEEDLHDEDCSTTSSIVGAQLTGNGLRKQPFCSKMPDKPYRQTRRFMYDRFRSKEPLVKLESKTFDEEEYTKITTPRQDVLFKKGYFGRKRESSLEETTPSTGEMDSEEPLMDQIIITNGFVDERGHYLVNGNSYEIYDPYSNTVTVVVGPPPYANGVSHPVLAAVSCQPVPLQPVDWYPPGADWPSQGSAWTPSYPRNPPSDSLNSPEPAPNFPSPDTQHPHPYDHPTFLVPAYLCSDSPLYNGVPLQSNPSVEPHSNEENRPDLKETRRKSTESVAEERPDRKEADEKGDLAEELFGSALVPDKKQEILPVVSPPSPPENRNASPSPPKVHKQSHSTQTNLLEDTARPSAKQSHSTQTPSEDAFRTTTTTIVHPRPQQRSNWTPAPADIPLPPPAKPEGDIKPAWKTRNRCNDPPMRIGEESQKKTYQQRASFAEKAGCGPVKVSHARKTMSGPDGGRVRTGSGAGRVANGGLKGYRQNGEREEGGSNESKREGGGKELGGRKDRRNGLVKGVVMGTGKKRSWGKYNEGRLDEGSGKCVEVRRRSSSRSRSRTRSEKSLTISELSSPTELSSGQTTPPEKLIIEKMEQEISKSFEVKLKQNLTTEKGVEEAAEEEEEEEKEEEEEEEERVEEKGPEKAKRRKKKKNKGKSEAVKERRKKRVEGGVKEKRSGEKCGEELGFLSGLRQKELLFDGWESMKDSGQDLLSQMGSLLNGDEEMLKSLGIEGRVAYSKLPLHSDLLMILPSIGWSRPMLRIEDLFGPAPFDSDLFTKRNLTNMKSTRPEEFFASVVDDPVVEKAEKKKEGSKRGAKTGEGGVPGKKGGKRERKGGAGVRGSAAVVAGAEGQGEGRLGIVEAVNTWLQEQGDSEKVLSIEGLGALLRDEEVAEEKSEKKNGGSNPIYALCAEEGGGGGGGGGSGSVDMQERGGYIRVANVINDGFMHVREEFPGGVESGRMYRSSSWDAKLSDGKIRKHFKFLTDSASFCQDLISDVRNGLPAGSEYATEELCDPKQTVRKYYTLACKAAVVPRSDSDSENEVFDALEYKFLQKETNDATPNGNASITDSGVHSDVELSEEAPTDHLKEKTCKLQ